MTPRESAEWEVLRQMAQRPIRRRESAPAAWLVLVTGVVLAVLAIVGGYWLWVK